MEADDPTLGYMLQAGARLCKCLGNEFIPYLSIVMPPLIKSANIEPDIKVRCVCVCVCACVPEYSDAAPHQERQH